jgi:hypothetical protein
VLRSQQQQEHGGLGHVTKQEKYQGGALRKQLNRRTGELENRKRVATAPKAKLPA